jgi:hypothetical protein
MRARSPDYLTSVKAKENRDWSDKDKIRVYTLRDDHQAKEIARMFNTTVNQVYNITRIVKNSLNDQCYHCGNALSKKEKAASEKLNQLCTRCKKESQDHKKRLRNKALKHGLCGYCHKRKVIKGKKACVKCLSASYRRRQQQGLCGICGKHPAIKGGALCRKCLDTNNIKTTISRQRKKNESHAT